MEGFPVRVHAYLSDQAEADWFFEAFIAIWKASYSDRELLLLMVAVDHAMLP